MYSDKYLLEFDKVLELVSKHAATDYAKKSIKEITPTNNTLVIQKLLKEVDQAFVIIYRLSDVPLGGLTNILDSLKRASIGSTLSGTELLNIASLIDVVSNNRRFFSKVNQLDIKSDSLEEYFLNLIDIPSLKREIFACIDERGNVLDSASSELKSIRMKIKSNESKIKEKLNNILRTQSKKLSETLITIRNNRFVVPVRVEFKNSFKGIIHDQSSSGETVFIEPAIISDVSNEISGLESKEKKEIEKILGHLTILVSDVAYDLENNYKLLIDIDIIFAKAKYAILNDCNLPTITDQEVDLINARHPLIPKEEIVANTISFKDYKTIIITGPNTGGKTVSLKTLGLLSIMVQSGLLIPVDPFSKTVIFDNIFADIGDEQSIEQSLSTFSSHMTRIISVLDKLSYQSLVLLDELGSGTDPKEGASLATSILDYIRERGVYIIATTHYPELKAYAYDKDDVMNASVEFDINTLSPTYKLLIGIPGKSNAFEISKRLGLNEKIISKARENVKTMNTKVSDLINKLEKRGLELEDKISEYNNEIHNYESKIIEYEDKIKKVELEKSNILQEAIDEKAKILFDTKEKSNKIINELNELKKEASFKEHKLADLKYKVKNLSEENNVSLKALSDKEIKIGDTVKVLPFNRNAEVIKKLRGDKWEVKMGALSSVFKNDELEFVSEKVNKENIAKIKKPKGKKVSTELDLRGLRFNEAMIMLDKYIDDAIVSNIQFAYLIHGHGTGAIRKGVQDYLSKNNHIKKYRYGGEGEGGNGVTVVYFI